MPRTPKTAAAAADADSNNVDAKSSTPRPAQEDAAKVSKPTSGKGSGKRGRPKMDPALRKTQVYVPTGRPRGRPPKDPSQKKAPATPKSAGTGRGRGRPLGSKSKKTGTPSATAVAAAAAVAAGESPSVVKGKRGRKSKATLEAERVAREAAEAGAEDGSEDDEEDGSEEGKGMKKGSWRTGMFFSLTRML